jgi:fructokinase
VDANLRPAVVPDMDAYRASVMAALQQAHLIKVSDDDLDTLGVDGADTMGKAGTLLASTPAQWLALTLGAGGAVLLARDGRAWHSAESAPVTVIDTVGAGDCFLAGLLVALLQRHALQQRAQADDLRLDATDAQHLLTHAVASASLCVMRTGCTPPSLSEVVARTTASPPLFRSL